jgi:hypothetical protein
LQYGAAVALYGGFIFDDQNAMCHLVIVGPFVTQRKPCPSLR